MSVAVLRAWSKRELCVQFAAGNAVFGDDNAARAGAKAMSNRTAPQDKAQNSATGGKLVCVPVDWVQWRSDAVRMSIAALL